MPRTASIVRYRSNGAIFTGSRFLDLGEFAPELVACNTRPPTAGYANRTRTAESLGQRRDQCLMSSPHPLLREAPPSSAAPHRIHMTLRSPPLTRPDRSSPQAPRRARTGADFLRVTHAPCLVASSSTGGTSHGVDRESRTAWCAHRPRCRPRLNPYSSA